MRRQHLGSVTNPGPMAVPRAAGPIPDSRPTLDLEDQRAVAEAMARGTLELGENLVCFERELAHCLEREQTVAVTSGSAALHLALIALGVGQGDQVALASYGPASLLQAVRRTGAEPLLVDCDPATFAIDPDDLRRRLNPRVRATVLAHPFGVPVNVEPFLLGPRLIEDVATALGARRHGRLVGTAGEITICSFDADQMITTGRGGAVAGDNAGFMARVADLVDFNSTKDAAVRYDERMGEVAAALGLSQLRRLSSFIERRRALAAIYTRDLAGSPLGLPGDRNGCEPCWQRYVVRVAGGSQWIRARLAARGIDSPRPVRQPLHWILGRNGYPGTETAHREALSLPLYPALEKDDARRVAHEVLRCLGER